MGLRPKPPAAASGDPGAPRHYHSGLRPEPPAAASGDPGAPRHYHSGLRPEPPAAASGDPVAPRHYHSGLRPEPPAAASGDPDAPRRAAEARGARLGDDRWSSPFLNGRLGDDRWSSPFLSCVARRSHMVEYARSSRLVSRAPDRSRCDAGFHHWLLAAVRAAVFYSIAAGAGERPARRAGGWRDAASGLNPARAPWRSACACAIMWRLGPRRTGARQPDARRPRRQ